jgi:hypothetical protein
MCPFDSMSLPATRTAASTSFGCGGLTPTVMRERPVQVRGTCKNPPADAGGSSRCALLPIWKPPNVVEPTPTGPNRLLARLARFLAALLPLAALGPPALPALPAPLAGLLARTLPTHLPGRCQHQRRTAEAYQ